MNAVRTILNGPVARAAGARAVTATAAALVLAGLAAYCYLAAPGVDAARQRETLAQLRELKAIDARWDVAVLRARAEPASMAYPGAGGEAMVDRARRALAAAAGDPHSVALAHALPELDKAVAAKAELVSEFVKASAALGQKLEQVAAAEAEIAGLVRGVWRDYPERERLVAVENVVALLIAETQKYALDPREALRKSIDTLLADLADATSRTPPALTSGIARLTGAAQELLDARPAEQALFTRLVYHPAGPRIDGLAREYAREQEQMIAVRARYLVYAAASGGALLLVLCYIAVLFAALRRGPAASGPPEPLRVEPELPVPADAQDAAAPAGSSSSQSLATRKSV